MKGDRFRRGVDVDRPRGYTKIKLRRWLRHTANAAVRIACTRLDMTVMKEAL